MMYGRFSKHTVVLAFLSAGVAAPATSSASPVSAGFDNFRSIPGNGDHTNTMAAGTWFDFGGQIGIVDFAGLPIGPGRTDTIVERLGDANFPFEGTNLWPGDPTLGTATTIDIELVALSLVSIAPIDLGGTLFDVFMVVDPVTRSLGTMTLEHEWADSGDLDPEGTFDSQISVWVDAMFVPVGGGPGAFQVDIDDLSLTSTDTLWSHGGDGFVTPEGVLEVHIGLGNHPVIPAPTSLSLLAFGGLMLAGRRRA
jgi:hypothetical protein